MDLGQQLHVGVGHVQPVQRIQNSLKARHGVVAGLGVGDGQQPLVDVCLRSLEGERPLIQRRLVGVGVALGVVEALLGILDLLLEKAVLGVDVCEQRIEGIEVGGRLQLVVEVVGGAHLALVHGVDTVHGVHDAWSWWGWGCLLCWLAVPVPTL
jgi:hypothetical protein